MFLFAGGKDLEPIDFLPGWWTQQEQDEETSEEALRAKAAQVFAAFGGIDKLGS